jgi:hypothetical protein
MIFELTYIRIASFINSQRSHRHPPWSELSFLAKMWIEQCNNRHSNCLKLSHNTRLPTRLLAIDKGYVKLVLSKGLPKYTKYATLSHCWGIKHPAKLTMSNFAAFRHSIPEGELCKTFKDAISIALTFDLEYLWIDSLASFRGTERTGPENHL